MTPFMIANGPSKYDLSVALFDGDSNQRKKVTFSGRFDGNGKNPTIILIGIIQQVGREDGSGDSWLIQFYTKIDNTSVLLKGYYSTKNRSGWLTID